MDNNRFDHLEKRVDGLESDIKPLGTLPAQMEMLIDIQKENNKSIRELTQHIQDNYVSEKLCNERCNSSNKAIDELKKFQLWVFASLITGGAVVILELIKWIGGKA